MLSSMRTRGASMQGALLAQCNSAGYGNACSASSPRMRVSTVLISDAEGTAKSGFRGRFDLLDGSSEVLLATALLRPVVQHNAKMSTAQNSEDHSS